MYKAFMKHAEKLIKNEAIATRPALQAVKHFENGDLVVTDSHRLYYAKDIHDKGEALLTPSGKEVKGNYPDVQRLFPTDPQFSQTYDVDELSKGVDTILTAAKVVGDKVPLMQYAENVLSFDSEEVKARYELDHSLDMKLWSNAQYWMDALRLFKAFKYTELTLNIHGSMRPFTLVSPDEKLTALILPIRRYS